MKSMAQHEKCSACERRFRTYASACPVMPCSMISVGLLGSPACRYRVRYGPAWMNPWLNSTSRRSDQTLVNGRGAAEISVTIHSQVVCAIYSLRYALSEPHGRRDVKPVVPCTPAGQSRRIAVGKRQSGEQGADP